MINNLNDPFIEFSVKLKLYSLDNIVFQFLCSSLKIKTEIIEKNEQKYAYVNLIIEKLKLLSTEDRNKFSEFLENNDSKKEKDNNYSFDRNNQLQDNLQAKINKSKENKKNVDNKSNNITKDKQKHVNKKIYNKL